MRETYPGLVLDLSSIDLEEIANALADQTDYEHHWLINPDTGEIAFWTADTGIDGQRDVGLPEQGRGVPLAQQGGGLFRSRWRPGGRSTVLNSAPVYGG